MCASTSCGQYTERNIINSSHPRDNVFVPLHLNNRSSLLPVKSCMHILLYRVVFTFCLQRHVLELTHLCRVFYPVSCCPQLYDNVMVISKHVFQECILLIVLDIGQFFCSSCLHKLSYLFGIPSCLLLLLALHLQLPVII